MSTKRRSTEHVVKTLISLAATSCALVVSFDDHNVLEEGQRQRGVAPPARSVAGVALGLDDARVVLMLGDERLEVGDGPFTFATKLYDGFLYSVVTFENPKNHICSVERGSGTISGADVGDVRVVCPSTIATLDDIKLSAAALTPAFDRSLNTYTASARLAGVFTPSVTTLEAKTTDKRAHIEVAGAAGDGMVTTSIPLKAGSNSIEVNVTAADGLSKRRYTITATIDALDYLKASNARADAGFGNSLALANDTLAVGAWNQWVNNETVLGAAYVFTRKAGVWAQEAFLKVPTQGFAQAYSGTSVALSGDTLAVGAFLTREVYVFTRSNGVWSEQARLYIPEEEGVFFGRSLALSGDTLVVGSGGGSHHYGGDFVRGRVYVFTRDGSAWAQRTTIESPVSQTCCLCTLNGCPGFSLAVALDGDTLAIGAPNDPSANNNRFDTSAPGAGSVYVFRGSGASWIEEAYIKASTVKPKANFGYAVSLSNGALAIGSPGDSNSAGAVYTLTRSGTTWSEESYLKAANARDEALFGASLHLVGDALAVGAMGESSGATFVGGNEQDTSAPKSGAAYLFVRTAPAKWTQRTYVKASNTRSNAAFGSSIAISNGTLAVGSEGESSDTTTINGVQQSVFAPNAGAVYVY